jgi:hypothetical protein
MARETQKPVPSRRRYPVVFRETRAVADLYSSVWFDFTKERAIVAGPDRNGRYYLLPMLDMWTDVLPGWRTTGT